MNVLGWIIWLDVAAMLFAAGIGILVYVAVDTIAARHEHRVNHPRRH